MRSFDRSEDAALINDRREHRVFPLGNLSYLGGSCCRGMPVIQDSFPLAVKFQIQFLHSEGCDRLPGTSNALETALVVAVGPEFRQQICIF